MGVTEYMHNAFANAKRKFVDETFNYISEINKFKKYNCSSEFPQINGAEFSLVKAERCFTYSAKANVIEGNMLFNNGAYGLTKEFKLIDENSIIEVPHASAVSLNIGGTGEAFTISGEIAELKSSFVSDSKKHYRLIVPKENNLDKNHKTYLESERFVTNDTVHLLGLMEFNCFEELFHVFDYSDKDKHYLIIDAIIPILYPNFEKAIAAILYSIGFLTGYVPRDETYILQAEDFEFKVITGFKFRKIENTISSGMEVVSPLLLSEAMKSNIISGHVPLDVFNRLCTKALEDKRFLRALKIICEGNTYPLEIRASTYSVALETVKNIINEEHSEKVNPFKDKHFANSTIESLIETINGISDDKFNSKETITKKLKQLNQVTNRDSFKVAFQMCGVNLTKGDEEALILRNDFLHGRLPFEDEEDFKQNQELKYTTYKLHFLVSLLIMKYCGYEGYIINSPKLFSLLSPDGKKIMEPAFWTIY